MDWKHYKKPIFILKNPLQNQYPDDTEAQIKNVLQKLSF